MRQYRFVDLCVLCASVCGVGRGLLCDNVTLCECRVYIHNHNDLCFELSVPFLMFNVQGYMTSYQDNVSDINKQQERELQVESKWCSNWASSVNRIKQLYS